MQNLQLELNELKTTEDFRRLVDAINQILCMDSDVEAGVVTAAHQTLDRAVRLVNDRLKKCDALLQKGLRAEALQESQIEPPLLDAIAVLDFDEQELWNNYARECGFPRAPELLVDVADDLQTAWADEEPLTDLRYRHRLHALARSPLPIRIEILRQLAKVDANNPLWDDEILIYEKARLAEVLEECKKAAAREDLERIVALEVELKSSGWRVAPSKKLIGFAESKSQELESKRARIQLAELEPKLNEAYSLSDVETARKLREEWGRHASVARLSEQDPLMQKVHEPFKWLVDKDRQDREQAAFEAAVFDLEQALDRQDAVKADFEPLYYKIEQFGRGVPEKLQERVSIRVLELDAADARRRKNKALGIAAGAVAALVLIGVAVFFYARNAELANSVAVLEGLLDEEQLIKAEAYVAEIEESNPRVHGHRDFQSLVTELDGLIEADEDRRKRFQRLIKVAETATGSIAAEDPATLEFSRVNKGYDALKKARQLVREEEEEAAVKRTLEKLSAKVTQEQKTVDDRYLADVAAFRDELGKLDPDALAYAKELQQFQSRAKRLKDERWISPGLGARSLDPVLAKIDLMIEQDVIFRAEAAALADIRDAIGDPNRYRLKLEAFVKDNRFTGSARQEDFQDVLQHETALWEGFEEWRKLKTELEGIQNLTKLNPDYAPDLAGGIRSFLKDHPGFPQEAEIQAIAEYLDILAIRASKELQLDVEKMVDQPIYADLLAVHSKAANQGVKSYYMKSKSPPRELGSGFQVRYVTSVTLEDEVVATIPKNQITNPILAGGHDWESPQMKLGEFIKDKMRDLSKDPAHWERDFLEILSRLHADENLDDYLRLLMIKAIMKTACQGSLYLRDELQEDLADLERFGLQLDPDTNWIAPNDARAGVERKQAANILSKLAKDPSEVAKGVPGYLKTLENIDLGPGYDWAGWLHKDRKDQWTVTYKGKPPRSETPAKLFVISRSGTAGPVNLTEIGKLQLGDVTVTVPDGSPALKQGRPVYVAR